MPFRTLMVTKAVACLIMGTLLALVPGRVAAILGVAASPGTILMARLYAATAFGNFTLSWFARNEPVSDARRAIALDLLVYDAIGFAVALLAVISGVMNALGWFAVAIYLFFALGFGYHLVAQPRVAHA